MALILENSKCSFCEHLLEDGRKTGALPALFDAEHKYAICSDSGFHVECFENWEHGAAVKSVYDMYLQLCKQKPSIPEGMSFDDFEKTTAYKDYMDQENALLQLEN